MHCILYELDQASPNLIIPRLEFQLSKFNNKIFSFVSAARSLTCRDDLDSKWRLLLAENELSRYLCCLECYFKQYLTR